MAEPVSLDELVFRRDLYPRHVISVANVRRLGEMRDAGLVLDPVVACRETHAILDGIHRWTEARQRGDEVILAEWQDCATDAERFETAIRLNASHGLRLGQYDRLRVIQIGDDLGLPDTRLADALSLPVARLRAIRPRFATVSEAIAGTSELRRRRVPLKASVRHLSGQHLTPAQAREIEGGAPGAPYLQAVRQLSRAIRLGLLPSQARHPALWADLGLLRQQLTDLLGDDNASAAGQA